VKHRSCAAALRDGWGKHGAAVLLAAVAFMVLAAAWRLFHAVPFLLWTGETPHPTDLHARHGEVARWFQGIFVDPRAGKPDYPPASYVMLWPLLGWLDLGRARWLWGLTGLAALAWFGWMAARESGARTRTAALMFLVLPFSGYATSATFTVGQLGGHVVPLLVGGLLLLRRRSATWWNDVRAAVMVLFALVKPILSVPFFWIVLLAVGRLRPALLVVGGYLALTAWAASFPDAATFSVLSGWLEDTPNLAEGTVNLHKALYLVGHASWVLAATAVTLVAFGWWVFRNRGADLWILMGAAALVTRLAFHHRLYDDVLLLVPMITLFRLAVAGDPREGRDLQAGVLFALTWTTVHMPAQLFVLAPPMPMLVGAGQAAVWTGSLLFLLGAARRGPAPPGGGRRRPDLDGRSGGAPIGAHRSRSPHAPEL
jgi:hypothetical protein